MITFVTVKVNKNDMIVSMYKDTYQTEGTAVQLSAILKGIKEGRWRDHVEKIRAGDSDLKLKSPAFTPSGVFGSSREDSDLITPSHLAILDIDTDQPHYKDVITNDPYTFAAFRSISNKGFAVVVKIDLCEDAQDHKNLLNGIIQYYTKEYQIPVDPTCKNQGRLRYISYDPNLYGNQNSEVWTERVEMQRGISGSTNNKPVHNIPHDILVSMVVKAYEHSVSGFGGTNSRHEWVYSLLIWFNRAGVSEEVAKDFVIRNYPIPERDYKREHTRSARHVYRDNPHEHGAKVPKEFYSAQDLKRYPQHGKYIFKWFIERRKESLLEYAKSSKASEKAVGYQSDELEFLIELYNQL